MFFIANKPVLYHLLASVLRSFVASFAVALGLRMLIVYHEIGFALPYFAFALALWRLCYEDNRELRERFQKPIDYGFVLYPITITCAIFPIVIQGSSATSNMKAFVFCVVGMCFLFMAEDIRMVLDDINKAMIYLPKYEEIMGDKSVKNKIAGERRNSIMGEKVNDEYVNIRIQIA